MDCCVDGARGDSSSDQDHDEDEFYDAMETPEPLDLLATDLDEDTNVPEGEGYTEGIPWTVDSGASKAVASHII